MLLIAETGAHDLVWSVGYLIMNLQFRKQTPPLDRKLPACLTQVAIASHVLAGQYGQFRFFSASGMVPSPGPHTPMPMGSSGSACEDKIYHWYAFTNGMIHNWYRFTVQSV